MASTYSPSLKITLMGDGDQSGLWGQTTNTNLGTLLEQAITGVQPIVMSDANYTLTSFNGISDEARNAVLVVTGTNNAIRDLIPPVVEKLYTIANNTTGGYAIRVIGASGTGVTIPNGTTCLVYCDGTNFINGLSGSAGNFSVAGDITATGNATANNVTVTNTLSATNIVSSNATFVGGTVNVPTVANSSNTTVAASTAFVKNNITAQGLGTMSTQNANNVAITGGTISGLGTPLPVASGGTGAAELSQGYALVGNGFAAVNAIAPGTAGNVFTSNGSNWVSAAPAAPTVTIRAWFYYNGSTVQGSFNITSVTNVGTGLYNVVFTTAVAASTYSYAVSGMGVGDGRPGGYTAAQIGEDRGGYFSGTATRTTTTISLLRYRSDNGNLEDGPFQLTVVG
jgi:hypothetical protein